MITETVKATIKGTEQRLSRLLFKIAVELICISNSYDGIILYENGVIVSTKKNKSEHGKGLENVRRTAEKYNGLLKLSHNENVFTSEVLLYLP